VIVAGADRWHVIEQIFHEAVGRPVDERARFLDVACAGDEEIRRELESLLANDGQGLLARSAMGLAAADMTRPVQPSWVGRTLRAYKIVALVGAGGMGEVYRARDVSLGREVALKLLPHQLSADPERVARLEREARILASLNHPRIATLYGLEEWEGQRFLVMELVPGQTLADLVRHGTLPVPKAIEICRQIAEGLEAAHDAGIVHRDLKPANVKITPDGQVKLLDFGLAKALEPAPGVSDPPVSVVERTEEGTILGTPAYMSPEQARGQLVNRRTDIWAFGCCLYESLCGRSAFKGDTVTDTLAAVLDKDPDWAAIGEDVPPAARRLVRRCLAKDMRQRLQHIGDARLELEEAVPEASVPAPSRWPRYAWPALVFVALLIAIVPWLLTRLGGGQAARNASQHVVRLTLNWKGEGTGILNLPVQAFYVPFAISPDGDRIVFRGRGGGRSQLFLRELSGFTVTPIAGTETATSPFFSSDGRWIGFWRAEDRMLRKVSVEGGAPIELAPTDSVHAALWLPNDEIVIDTGYPGSELWSIPAGGGTPTAMVVRDRADGEQIRLRAGVPGSDDLLVASITPNGTWLDVLSRETGKRRRLVKGGGSVLARYTRSGHLVFADGDALFAVPLNQRLEPAGDRAPVLQGIDHHHSHSNVALSDNGTVVYLPAENVREAELAWLNRAAVVTPVPGGRGPFLNAVLSPDGKEAAAELLVGTTTQVWILDLARGTRRLLCADDYCGDPIWSHDGTTITYAVLRNNERVLCRARADGTGAAERLVHRTGWAAPEDWSPDGRSLLFSEYTTRGDSDIWIYANGEARPLISTRFSEGSPRFSPDGRFIAFEADDGGVSQVYLQPFHGPGPRVTVSTEEGGGPRWGADGRHLFYGSGKHLMVVDVQTFPALHIGDPRTVIDQTPPWFCAGIVPDGQRFLIFKPRTTEGPPELRIVLNWFEELERLAPHSRR